jgi:hypothetical protein
VLIFFKFLVWVKTVSPYAVVANVCLVLDMTVDE